MSQRTDYDRELDINRKYFESHADEIRSMYAGRFVALAFGKVVAAEQTVPAVMAALDRVRPRPLHVEVFPAETEPLFDSYYSPYAEFID